MGWFQADCTVNKLGSLQALPTRTHFPISSRTRHSFKRVVEYLLRCPILRPKHAFLAVGGALAQG